MKSGIQGTFKILYTNKYYYLQNSLVLKKCPRLAGRNLQASQDIHRRKVQQTKHYPDTFFKARHSFSIFCASHVQQIIFLIGLVVSVNNRLRNSQCAELGLKRLQKYFDRKKYKKIKTKKKKTQKQGFVSNKELMFLFNYQLRKDVS